MYYFHQKSIVSEIFQFFLLFIMAACETVHTTSGIFYVLTTLCEDEQRLVFRQVEVTLNTSSEREQITPTL